MAIGIAEIRYQIESLGNYIKGLQLAADLLRRSSTDRHLLSRLGEYLVQVLTHASVPWLPDLSTFSFPSSLYTSLRPIPPRAPKATAEIGELLCLLVDKDGEGFIRLFRCKHGNPQRQSEFSPNITDTVQECILRACREVNRYLDTHYHLPSLPDPDTGYSYEIVGGPLSPANEIVEGRSLEGAAVLAFLSLRTQVPLPTDIAVTGQLEGLTVTAVSGVEQKVRAVVRERPYVKRVFIPQTNLANLPSPPPPQVEPIQDLPAIIEKVFKGRFAERITREGIDTGAILATARKEYEDGDYRNASKKLKELLRHLPVSRGHRYNRFFCWWRLGSIATHWGDIAQADTAFAQALEMAEALWGEGRLSNEEYLNLYVSYAVHLTDLYRYKEAERALRENTVCLGGHHYQANVKIKLLGTLGQLYRFAGRFTEAEQVLTDALQLIDPEVEGRELPREHTYLGTLYTDMGKYDLAEEHFRRAEEINQALPKPSSDNERFARVYASRLFYRQRKYDRSRQVAERAIEISSGFDRLFPACVARRYQGLSLIALGQKEGGRQILRAEMVPPFGAVDWPSPNIRVIRDASVIELALHLLQEGECVVEDLGSLLRHVLTGLKNFPAARHVFKSDIARLQRHLAAKKLNPPLLQQHLSALRDKIHT